MATSATAATSDVWYRLRRVLALGTNTRRVLRARGGEAEYAM